MVLILMALATVGSFLTSGSIFLTQNLLMSIIDLAGLLKLIPKMGQKPQSSEQLWVVSSMKALPLLQAQVVEQLAIWVTINALTTVTDLSQKLVGVQCLLVATVLSISEVCTLPSSTKMVLVNG